MIVIISVIFTFDHMADWELGVLPHESLACEKIKVQNLKYLKYGFYGMSLAFAPS